jgi:hypothetical protein
MAISILSNVHKPASFIAPFLGAAAAVATGVVFGYNQPLVRNCARARPAEAGADADLAACAEGSGQEEERERQLSRQSV